MARRALKLSDPERKQADYETKDTDLWREFLTPGGVCGLCGNMGYLNTRVTTPSGTAIGITNGYCICPNGRRLKEIEQGMELNQ